MSKNNIIVNQIGYLPSQKKFVLFKQGRIGESFVVVRVEDEKEVYRGKINTKLYSEAAKEEVYIGEFSQLELEGKYEIINERNEKSYPFMIKEQVYKEPFKDLVRFFYMQRCGEEIPQGYGDKWAHPACHLGLGRIYGSHQRVDVSGGWHDAGDYGRYTVATSKAVADLLLAYEANPKAFNIDFNVPRREKEMPYILEEIKRQLIWLFKMQNLDNGGVYHKVTCAKFPSYDCMPQDEKEELIVCPISTAATGTFTAVMAMAYDTYKEIDKELAKNCLKAAKKAWKYLMNAPESNFRNPEGIITGEYGGESDLEERYWAAAELFRVTGELEFDKVAKSYAIKDDLMFAYGWSAVGAYGDKAYLRAEHVDEQVCRIIKDRIIERAKCLLKAAKQDGYGIEPSGKMYIWGSNMYISMLAVFLQDAYEIEQNDAYLEQARRYMDYCFGMNPLNICYITGHGSHYPKHLHHRPSIAQKENVPGMLAGGASAYLADPIAKRQLQGVPAAKCYLDHEESYGTNESDIYWNSMIVYALARLDVV